MPTVQLESKPPYHAIWLAVISLNIYGLPFLNVYFSDPAALWSWRLSCILAVCLGPLWVVACLVDWFVLELHRVLKWAGVWLKELRGDFLFCLKKVEFREVKWFSGIWEPLAEHWCLSVLHVCFHEGELTSLCHFSSLPGFHPSRLQLNFPACSHYDIRAAVYLDFFHLQPLFCLNFFFSQPWRFKCINIGLPHHSCSLLLW